MTFLQLKTGNLIVNTTAIAAVERIGVAPTQMLTIWLTNGLTYTVAGPDVQTVLTTLGIRA